MTVIKSRSSFLGATEFQGGFKLDFYRKKDQIIAKLWQENKKLGVYYLDDFSRTPTLTYAATMTYEKMPEAERVKLATFLEGFGVQMDRAVEQVVAPYLKRECVGHHPVIFNHHILTFDSGIGSSDTTHRYGLIRLYNLKVPEFQRELPKWHIRMFQRPIYQQPLYSDGNKVSGGDVGVIRGWAHPQGFIISPFFSSVNKEREILLATEKFVLTTDPSATLCIWDIQQLDVCIAELPGALTCYYQTEDYEDSDDEDASYPEKLKCNDSFVLKDQKIAILKENGELFIWDFHSKTCLTSLTKEQALRYGLVYESMDYDDNDQLLWREIILDETGILFYKNEYLNDLDTSTFDLCHLNLSTQTIKTHSFATGEEFVGIFNGQVLTIYNNNLYLRAPCAEEPRRLLMRLRIDPRDYYHDNDNYVVFVSKALNIYLLDIAQAELIDIPISGREILGHGTLKMRVIDGSLFFMKDSGFNSETVYSFDLPTKQTV